MSRLGLVISPGDATFTSFELMRARFLRQLRQDEFGPTNADCSAALRQLLSSFDRISQRLRALSPRNRELFSGVLATVAAGASERISFQSVIQQIGIAASDLARVVTKIDKSVRRRQFDAAAEDFLAQVGNWTGLSPSELFGLMCGSAVVSAGGSDEIGR